MVINVSEPNPTTKQLAIVSIQINADMQSYVLYRMVQKTDTQFYLWDNFGNSAPIFTILSLLQAEIYGA